MNQSNVELEVLRSGAMYMEGLRELCILKSSIGCTKVGGSLYIDRLGNLIGTVLIGCTKVGRI